MTEFCIILQLWYTNSFRWKDLMKALHLIFFFLRWKQAHVVSFRDTACLWDNPENLGSSRYSQVWTVEERSINFGYCSAQRISGVHTNEPSVTNGSDNSGDLSLRDVCLGKPRVCAKDLSPQAMLIPDDEAAVDKEWKDVIKRHTKQQQGKSTLLHWWTSANSKVHVHPGECSKEQSQVRKQFCARWICTWAKIFYR